MKKTNQDEILKELIKRVIQKDNSIQDRHEKEAIENATKETLIEMTNLSIEEINDIEKKIVSENIQKQKKGKKSITYIIVFSIFLCVFTYFYYSTHIKAKIDFKKNYKDSLVFEENFNDNSNKWPIYDDKDKKSQIKDGQYIFQVYSVENCKYALIPFKIRRYTKIQFTSTWLDGEQTYNGIKLKNTKNNFLIFAVEPEGLARLCKIINDKDKYTHYELDINNNTDRTKAIEQTIIIKSNIIEYYVNNQHIVTVYGFKAPFYKISFSNCPGQTIAIDNLKIWE